VAESVEKDKFLAVPTNVEFTTIVETVVVPKISSAEIVVDHVAALVACYLEVH
jgi:hypothetical protein